MPPSNSAATQYTEALPTAGGPKQTGKQKPKQDHSPKEVLGSHTTKKLDKHGADGKAAAKIAAETAPAPAVTTTEQTSQAIPDEPKPKHEPSGQAHPTDTGSAQSGKQPSAPAKDARPPASEKAQPPAEDPSGSSGLGEVLGQATGSSSSGGMGLLLPLVLLAAIAWAIAYARQRKRPLS